MKKLTTFGWVILALAATACTADSTPEHAVGTAFSALQKNNLIQFRETLSGTALEQYATQEGMTILQNKLGVQKLQVTTSQGATIEPTPAGAIDVYSVTVLNRDTHEKLLDLTVKCKVDQSIPPTECSGKVQVACGLSSDDHCTIDAIQIAN
jgi:hypothetical protein